MKKKLLLLADRHQLREQLINLGDRAIYDGLYEIMENELHLEVISGGWKNFPFFNLKTFRESDSEEEILKHFEKEVAKLLSYSNQRIEWEKKMLQFVDSNFIFNRGPLQWIEKRFQTKKTLGPQEALKPYVFRAAYADRLIQKIKKADFIMLYGSGASDNVSHYLPSFLLEIYLAKKLGKKVATINQTVHLDKPLAQRLLKTIYLLMDFNSVREPSSEKHLIDIGLPRETILLTCDGAFGIQKKALDISEVINSEQIENGYIAVLIRGDRKVDEKLWQNVIKKLEEKYHKEIVFLHTCKAHDEKVFQIIRKGNHLRSTKEYYDYPVVIELLKRASVLITDRYHAVIFSLMAGTPIAPLKTVSHKIDGLVELTGYPLKPCKMEPERIMDQVENAMSIKHDTNVIGNKACRELRGKLIADLQETVSRLGQ